MSITVTHFMRRPRAHDYSIERFYEDIRRAMPDDCTVSVWKCRHFSNGFWPRLHDVWHARRAQAEVNHVTGDVHFLTLLLDRKRTVLTVHDLVTLRRLRGLKRWVFFFFWYWLPIRRCCAVVVISESTRAQLLESVRCSPEKVHVIYDSVSDEFVPVARLFDSSCPRILQVGTGPNKNLERVAEALAEVRCRLVIVGPISEVQVSILKEYGIEYENHVSLSRDALVAQYVAADMLVFASTYEGFGLPIVEAHAVGRPVVTSNVFSMPEVAGGAACLVDPFDPASIRAGVQHIIENDQYRAQLVEAGYTNAVRFRAVAIAAEYAELYRQVVVRSKATRRS